MKKLFLSAFTVFALMSCAEKTAEDYVKDEFMNYVRTDFDNPTEFESITSIEPIDTLCNKDALDIIGRIESLKDIMLDSQKEKLNNIKTRLENDKTSTVTYELKVRLDKNGRKKVVSYYAIDDGFIITIQDHELQINETPKVYQDFYEFMYDLME